MHRNYNADIINISKNINNNVMPRKHITNYYSNVSFLKFAIHSLLNHLQLSRDMF